MFDFQLAYFFLFILITRLAKGETVLPREGLRTQRKFLLRHLPFAC